MRIFFILCLVLSIFRAEAQNSFFVFNKADNFGVIDDNGNVVIPALYEAINVCENSVFICFSNDKVGVLNSENHIIIPLEYDYIQYIDGDIFEVCKNEKWGAVNKDNKIVIPLYYSNIKICTDGNSIVAKDNKYGLLDNKGKIILDLQYDGLGGFKNIAYSEDMIVFRADNKYGYLDKNGKIVIAPIYSNAYEFEHGQAIVSKDGGVGIIDVNGNFIIEPDKYSNIFRYCNIYYAWKKDSRHKCILSLNGDILFDNMLGDFLLVKNGTIIVSENKKYGLIDTDGKIIIPIIYDGITEMGDNGLISVLKSGKWGIVNKNNDVVVDFKLVGMMRSFSGGLAVYYADNFSTDGRFTSQKAGYINEKGDIIIAPQFVEANDFKNDRAVVQTRTKKLLINTGGEIIYEFSSQPQSITMMEISE